MASTNATTVGQYLGKRLDQAGLKHIFGVPDDYVLDFFDRLEESTMQVIGTCNELNSGCAAAAYARLNGSGGPRLTERPDRHGKADFSPQDYQLAFVSFYLERFPNVILTPHNVFNTTQAVQRIIHTNLDITEKGEVCNPVN